MFNINKAGTGNKQNGKDKTEVRNLRKTQCKPRPIKEGAIFKSHFNFIMIYYVFMITTQSNATLRTAEKINNSDLQSYSQIKMS